jgi:hypothetical protein
MMNESARKSLEDILGQVRAEYEDDDELLRSYTRPEYFDRLMTITPTFLVGGRGTGKTTTLRLMAHSAQAKIAGSAHSEDWDVVAAYWKIEPSVASAFGGKGVRQEIWQRVFSHYLNLRLAALFVEFLESQPIQAQQLESRPLRLFLRSTNLPEVESVSDLLDALDIAIADIEGSLNGRPSALEDTPTSIVGRPLLHLFDAASRAGVSRGSPFMFCLDEYENLDSYQQRLVNTLIKEAGGSPYTFKVGVRNPIAIERGTTLEKQPLQSPADFQTVNIIEHLKGKSFEAFAEDVLRKRFSIREGVMRMADLLPGPTPDEEAQILGAAPYREQIIAELKAANADEALVRFAKELSVSDSALVVQWSKSHDETIIDTVSEAVASPSAWNDRVNNYRYAALFAIKANKAGLRKYYAGWRTYCQLADGNIRYLIRLVYEAFRLQSRGGVFQPIPVTFRNQTLAASSVGEMTIKDLRGWSRQGASLTRLVMGLGGIFGSLARDKPLVTAEVNQFSVSYNNSRSLAIRVENLLDEAVGQGLMLAVDGDKNPSITSGSKEQYFQLHPVFAPYFVYSHRRKRRLVLEADDLLSLTSREASPSAVLRILSDKGASSAIGGGQIALFDELS